MSYELPKDVQDAGQLFTAFQDAGDDLTGLEMLSATLCYASQHQLLSGEILILLDNLICEAGVRVVSALLHQNLMDELPAHVSPEAKESLMQMAARARAAVHAYKDGNENHSEWSEYGDADWIDHYGDAAWSRIASDAEFELTTSDYSACQQRFLDLMHTMEGHYCVVGGEDGVSLIHTEGMMSGYNADLDYNAQETVCDSSGFCRLINVDDDDSRPQRYDDDWSLDYVVEYTNRDKAGETVHYEASTLSHANDTDSDHDTIGGNGEVLDSAGDHGIVLKTHGDYCAYDPTAKKNRL